MALYLTTQQLMMNRIVGQFIDRAHLIYLEVTDRQHFPFSFLWRIIVSYRKDQSSHEISYFEP